MDNHYTPQESSNSAYISDFFKNPPNSASSDFFKPITPSASSVDTRYSNKKSTSKDIFDYFTKSISSPSNPPNPTIYDIFSNNPDISSSKSTSSSIASSSILPPDNKWNIGRYETPTNPNYKSTYMLNQMSGEV